MDFLENLKMPQVNNIVVSDHNLWVLNDEEFAVM